MPPKGASDTRTDAALRRLLRQRKKESRSTCSPCRARKVKCNNRTPCDKCIRSGYPDLCAPGTRARISEVLDQILADGVDIDDDEAISQSPSSLAQSNLGQHVLGCPDPGGVAAATSASTRPSLSTSTVRADGGQQNSVGSDGSACSGTITHTSEAYGTATETVEENHSPTFLGGNSIPTFLSDHDISAPGAASTSMMEAVMPILGLSGEPSIHPFLPPSKTFIQDVNLRIYDRLPPDREIIGLFRVYQKDVHPFSPLIPDLDSFELAVCEYLDACSNSQHCAQAHECEVNRTSSWKPISWLGSLFAVLATGTQYSHESILERRTKCSTYVRSSFHCLRMANFLTRPTFLCIQTLLILCHVLQTDMKPESAWILLGTTVRMAQSIGLHQVEDHTSLKAKLWLALLRQDSLLSLCYDRAPMAGLGRALAVNEHGSNEAPYIQPLDALCDLLLRSGIIGSQITPDFDRILSLVTCIEQVRSQGVDGLNSSAQGSTITQRCMVYLLELHSSFSIAWLCRPAFRGSRNQTSIAARQNLMDKCVKNLSACVKAFIKLHPLSPFALRSWAVIHNALTSALLLAFLEEARNKQDVRALQKEMLDIFSQVSDGEARQNVDGDRGIDLSAPHLRAVTVLRNLLNGDLDQLGSKHQLLRNSVATSIRRDGGSASDSSAEPTFGPPQEQQYSLQESPLDMLDSIIWDPMFDGEATAPQVADDLWGNCDLSWLKSPTR